MSRFNPTDKLALPSPALHLYWRPAQRQALGSSACQSYTLTAYPGFSFRDRRLRCSPPVYFLEGDPARSPAIQARKLSRKGRAGAAARWLALEMEVWPMDRAVGAGFVLMNYRRDAQRQPASRASERPSGFISSCLCEGENRRDSADNLI
ncbi:hypothetical protein KOW79_015216 [Hemibagrus wyckioides]|uniref:Uncharacterized protein n=1 Tax=Hemibagrus wyckioides TaxID=337641 RepID=A0A9D3NCD0_9TELE|nr:hypothetical protein KOW79_015216 [Hemibagrus wyckioides]